jgi:dolichyl-phosphate-mannose-protein mannosyltransferase
MLPASIPPRLAITALTLATGLLTFLQLGSLRTPRTYYAARSAGETVTADFGELLAVERVCVYVGLGTGSYRLQLSADGRTWGPGLEAGQVSPFGMVEWRVLPLRGSARCLRATSERPGLMLGEIAVFGPGRRAVAATGTRAGWAPAPDPAAQSAGQAAGENPYGTALPAGRPEFLFDEPRTASYTPTQRTGTYFDETYFARSAWEGLLGLPITETTHPPLAKLLMGAGLALFGVTPFGWRFAGALAGTLSVLLLYLLARRLRFPPGWALAAAALFALDFMRFVQSRMATPEPFVLLFVLLFYYFLLGFLQEAEEGRAGGPGSGRTVAPRRDSGRAAGLLVAAGVCLGAAAASKWIGLYPAAPAALLTLSLLWRRSRAPEPGAPLGLSRAGGLLRLALLGLGALVLVPAAVYLFSYVPLVVRQGWRPADVLAHQLHMFRYHSQVSETRWYASSWRQWPLMIRPVWLYRQQVDLPAGWAASIATLGNPAVWWPGAAALPALAAVALADLARPQAVRVRPQADRIRRQADPAAAFILLAFLGQYLPWVVAPRRLVFIYHFYTCVPFLILALVYVAGRWAGARSGSVPARPRGLPVHPRGMPARSPSLPPGLSPHLPVIARFWPAVAAGLFLLFYPLLAGVPVGPVWARLLKWLPTWIFYR